jgi:hypothetical protein
MLSLNLEDSTRDALAFVLPSDGMILSAEPNVEREPCVPELDEMRERDVQIRPVIGARVDLFWGGRLFHSCAKGYEIHYHSAVSGFSLMDIDSRKPLFHSYGTIWKHYDPKKSKQKGRKEIVLRSSNYLVAVNGPRLRVSALAA